MALLLLAGAGLASGAPVLLGLVDHAGSDPDLWTLSALNLRVRADPVVPPLYPALVALTGRPEPHLVDHAARLSALAAALLPLATFALARRLGAATPAAVAAGLLVLAQPVLLGMAAQVQPDALFALLLCAGLLAVQGWWVRGGALGLAVCLGLVALWPLAREQGLVAGALLGLLLVLGPGGEGRLGLGTFDAAGLGDRALRGLAALTALVLGPGLVGLSPGLPWDQPWFERLAMAAEVFEEGGLADRPQDASEALTRAYEQGDSAAILVHHLVHAVSGAPLHWALVLLGLGLALRLRAWPALVGIGAGLPALVVFSEPRHVAVVLPVVLAVLACARSRRLLALAGVLALGGAVASGEVRERLRYQAVDIASLRVFGAALCEKAGPEDLGSGEPRAFTFCPLPLHSPGEEQRFGADWRTWFVSEEGGPPGWGKEGLASDRFAVYRLQPELGERPCSSAALPPGLPYMASPPGRVRLVPPCEEGEAGEPGEIVPFDPLDRPKVKPRGRFGREP